MCLLLLDDEALIGLACKLGRYLLMGLIEVTKQERLDVGGRRGALGR